MDYNSLYDDTTSAVEKQRMLDDIEKKDKRMMRIIIVSFIVLFGIIIVGTIFGFQTIEAVFNNFASSLRFIVGFFLLSVSVLAFIKFLHFKHLFSELFSLPVSSLEDGKERAVHLKGSFSGALTRSPLSQTPCLMSTVHISRREGDFNLHGRFMTKSYVLKHPKNAPFLIEGKICDIGNLSYADVEESVSKKSYHHIDELDLSLRSYLESERVDLVALFKKKIFGYAVIIEECVVRANQEFNVYGKVYVKDNEIIIGRTKPLYYSFISRVWPPNNLRYKKLILRIAMGVSFVSLFGGLVLIFMIV